MRVENMVMAFNGLLAKKANQKSWHENKVKGKHLEKGSMFLNFASQRNKYKLKVQFTLNTQTND